jgi:hypothetical protein
MKDDEKKQIIYKDICRTEDETDRFIVNVDIRIGGEIWYE